MSTLIVTAHPDERSLTHQIAQDLVRRLPQQGADVAHLAQEGFDPRFTLADRRHYLGDGAHEVSVLREQERLDRASDVVLVFPVYWWSMPALLKGWIDRVFTAGWAFDDDGDGSIRPRLQHLTMHLVPVSGTSEESFARHGYGTSFTTQIERGIIGFCGMRQGATAFVHDSESGDADALRRSVLVATGKVADAMSRGDRSVS